MFDHSIKVPRLYKAAAKTLKEAKESGSSLKQLVYEVKHPNLKAIYALVTETLRKKNVLDKLLKKSQILVKESRLDPFLAQILITELLWGKKQLMGQSKPVITVLAYKQIFEAHLSDFPSDVEMKSVTKVNKPRYVRVNTLSLTLNEAVDAFRDEGWTLVRFLNKDDYDGFLQKVSSLKEDEFMVDMHIEDLLIFPPKTEFYQHAAYKEGSILLQDKASCLPVKILNPPPNSTILDMCAAPGMKTTQIAAMINNNGVIYAVEQNEKRFNTLNKLIELSGAKCVKTIQNDVLKLTGEDCSGVEYIIVDPSCSGSGIIDRLELDETKETTDENRLEKLQRFQIKILKHALYKFPDVKRVVYSTCSLYPKENEEVVNEVLKNCKNFKLAPVKNFLNASWKNFGSDNYEFGEYCLYSKPEEDLTNGFFVAVFERVLDENKTQKVKKNKKELSNQEDKNKHKSNETFQNVYVENNSTKDISKKHKKHKNKNCQENEQNTEETMDVEFTENVVKKSKQNEKIGDLNTSNKKHKKNNAEYSIEEEKYNFDEEEQNKHNVQELTKQETSNQTITKEKKHKKKHRDEFKDSNTSHKKHKKNKTVKDK